MVRAAVKLLPWEVAHVFVHHVYAHFMATPEADEPTWFWILCVLSMAGALGYVVTLFVGDGRTPYDRIAGTRVLASDEG